MEGHINMGMEMERVGAKRTWSVPCEKKNKEVWVKMKQSRSLHYKRSPEDIEVIIENPKKSSKDVGRTQHETVNSWFSLIANQSERPSFFSKFSRSDHFKSG